MDRRIEDARQFATAQALATMGEMVKDTGIPEPRAQRDECYMLLMKALHSNANNPFTRSDLERLTLRNGVPLLMLPNGWARVNDIAHSQYGLRSKHAHSQNWELRPEFAGVYIWNIDEQTLGQQIDIIFDSWNPDNLMKPGETSQFYEDVADLQEEMVYKTVAERVGVLANQIDDHKKAKIAEMIPVIQSYLQAGVPNPFKLSEIQKAITELRADPDPFAMDAMRLLVEDLSFEAQDEFAINQLTDILDELKVTPEVVGEGVPVVAESYGRYNIDAESGSSNGFQGEKAGEMQTPTSAFWRH